MYIYILYIDLETLYELYLFSLIKYCSIPPPPKKKKKKTEKKRAGPLRWVGMWSVVVTFPDRPHFLGFVIKCEFKLFNGRLEQVA